MQLVIDIDEYTYRKAKNENDYMSIEDRYGTIKGDVYESIAKGTVLPKGHGRLIDADAIKYTHSIARSIDDGHNWNELCVTADEIADVPTVIEAESEE